MSDILKAMAVSGSILLPVVILVILISIAAVKRGEHSMGLHGLPADAHGTPAVAGVAGAKAAVGTRDASVLEILVLGIIVFTVTMGLLIGVSVLQHMG